MNQPLEIDVFYDYSCPYVYAGSLWLREVKKTLGDDLVIRWRYFPLEQVNAEDPEFKLWEQPDDYASRARTAFHGAVAASKQGTELFERFHYGLLIAKHEDDKNHGRIRVLNAVAEDAGLDMEQFQQDMSDTNLWQEIGQDYEEGRNSYGVFGTPTLVFPGGQAAYVKMYPPAPSDEAMAVWEEVTSIVRNRPYLAEVKRPERPDDED